MPYAIGDVVWVPNTAYTAIDEQCPDCLGTCQWHCTLPNGEEFEIECPRCYPGGYAQSTGIVRDRYEWTVEVMEATIRGVALVGDNQYEYTTSTGYIHRDDTVCHSREEALAAGKVAAQKSAEYMEAENIKRGGKKGRPQRDKDGNRVANDMDCGSSWADYARRDAREAVRRLHVAVQYAARHGTVIDWRAMVEQAMAK